MVKDVNGVTAMLAHQARTANDNIFVRSIVESYMFLGFGTVISYKDERVTVSCGSRVYTNVEVMVLGVDGWGIKPVPAVNDRVLLLSTQSPVPDLQKFKAPGSMPAYDLSGLKAVPITDSKTAQLITVDKDGVVITGDVKITVNADGIQVEDKNKNKLTTSKDGIVIEDKNGCTITTSSDGVDINGKLSIGK